MEVNMARGNMKNTALKTGASKKAPASNMERRMMTTDLTPTRGGGKVQTKAKTGSKRGR
jgi:hypothetical protein